MKPDAVGFGLVVETDGAAVVRVIGELDCAPLKATERDVKTNLVGAFGTVVATDDNVRDRFRPYEKVAVMRSSSVWAAAHPRTRGHAACWNYS